jgi:hypothetical protein
MLLTSMCMTAACSKDTTVPIKEAVTQEHDQVSSPLDAEHRSDESNSEEDTANAVKEPPASTDERTEGLGFSEVFKLDPDDSYYGSFVALNTNEVLAEIASTGLEQIKLIRINLKTGQKTIVQESSEEEQIGLNSLHRSNAGFIEWDSYSTKHPRGYMYRLDDHQQIIRVGNSVESPDGNWLTTPTIDDAAKGIWGTDQLTGKRKQWTDGANDSQPIWLPDSSGFIFLHDTGDNLGDGAGPRYELAKYDIQSHKVTILPYASGFWGMIEWLEPGVSVLAHNGFDDGVGLKIVNLDTKKEDQIIETSEYDYLSSSIIPTAHELLVSDHGTFRRYGSNGELISTIAWPTDFDEYTQKHIAEKSQTDEQTRNFYYAGEEKGARFGPSSLRFSPDGKRLAYLLGAIGESVDDMVEGTRIAVASSDGNGTKLLTNEYMHIENLQWSPDETSILALFTLEENRKQYYIGTIHL